MNIEFVAFDLLLLLLQSPIFSPTKFTAANSVGDAVYGNKDRIPSSLIFPKLYSMTS